MKPSEAEKKIGSDIERIIENWRNGNLTDAMNIIKALPPSTAAYVAVVAAASLNDGSIVNRLLSEGTMDLTEQGKNTIKLWHYEDAPDYIKYRSHHGGDEDVVVLVPPAIADTWLQCLDEGHLANDVQVEGMPDGSKLLIGAHS